MITLAWRQDWETKKGDIWIPYGYSLHLTKEDIDTFVEVLDHELEGHIFGVRRISVPIEVILTENEYWNVKVSDHGIFIDETEEE